MGNDGQLTTAQQRNLFPGFCYGGLAAATTKLDVPAIFRDFVYIDPTEVKLEIPCILPQVQPQAAPVATPKLKFKAPARRSSMADFLAPK